MKQITDTLIWFNGNEEIAKFIQVTGQDNYKDAAVNYWCLFSGVIDQDNNLIAGIQLASGNITIDGANYINWGNEPAQSVNVWIYNWVAEQLNLTII